MFYRLAKNIKLKKKKNKVLQWLLKLSQGWKKGEAKPSLFFTYFTSMGQGLHPKNGLG